MLSYVTMRWNNQPQFVSVAFVRLHRYSVSGTDVPFFGISLLKYKRRPESTEHKCYLPNTPVVEGEMDYSLPRLSHLFAFNNENKT